jgi:chromosome partitioning protein|tara:strand:- start:4203 stop:5372 length:1170 start_codon:yes stop_codon:yes gene_type:complete
MASDISQILNTCIQNGESVLEHLKQTSFNPDSVKRLERTFNLSQAANMIGVTTQGLRKAEMEGRLPDPEKNPDTGKKFYSLERINLARDYFNTRPGRREGDKPLVQAVINFKGGVFKTTISLHEAQYLALKGYRVLLIDADSQASTTRFFEFNPDDDDKELYTIGNYFSGEIDSLAPAILKTCWDGLDLIPANLNLYNAELLLPFKAGQGLVSSEFYNLLGSGIDTVKDNYDIVIIDAPPSLGIISMNVVYAADALLIPLPPSYSDFTSTLQFFNMLLEVVETLGAKKYKFIKLLLTKFDASEESKAFASVIRHVFGSDQLLRSIFSNSAEIPRASQNLRTVYEQTDIKVKKTYDRAINIIDKFCSELETLIKATWPSYAEHVLEEGVF